MSSLPQRVRCAPPTYDRCKPFAPPENNYHVFLSQINFFWGGEWEGTFLCVRSKKIRFQADKNNAWMGSLALDSNKMRLSLFNFF